MKRLRRGASILLDRAHVRPILAIVAAVNILIVSSVLAWIALDPASAEASGAQEMQEVASATSQVILRGIERMSLAEKAGVAENAPDRVYPPGKSLARQSADNPESAQPGTAVVTPHGAVITTEPVARRLANALLAKQPGPSLLAYIGQHPRRYLSFADRETETLYLVLCSADPGQTADVRQLSLNFVSLNWLFSLANSIGTGHARVQQIVLRDEMLSESFHYAMQDGKVTELGAAQLDHPTELGTRLQFFSRLRGYGSGILVETVLHKEQTGALQIGRTVSLLAAIVGLLWNVFALMWALALGKAVSKPEAQEPAVQPESAPQHHCGSGAADQASAACCPRVGGAQSEDGLCLANIAFNHSKDAVVITDEESRILDVNPAFTRITGYTRNEVIGRLPTMLHAKRRTVTMYGAIRNALQEVGYWEGEIWNTRKNGEIFAAHVSITAVRDERAQALRYVSVSTDVTSEIEHKKRIEQLAYSDPLTGLANRTLFMERLQMGMARAYRNETELVLCYLDLDGFKQINDTLGHDAGDAVLQQVSQRLQSTVRKIDTVSRLGGDEFVVILADGKGPFYAEAMTHRLLSLLQKPYEVSGRLLTITVSIGMAIYHRDDTSPDLLLRQADLAMYAAKRSGKNCCRIFGDDTHLEIDEAELLSTARAARVQQDTA